jgi:hypothetical protein
MMSTVSETAGPRIESVAPRDRDLWEVWWLAIIKENGTGAAQARTVADSVSSAVSFPLSPMIGVWLARRRGWNIVRSWLTLQFAFLLFAVARAAVSGPGMLQNDALAFVFSPRSSGC